jgi:AraC family transcriptional regulator, regulatory protein of adaptative response / methylated-DNA-[protein]-cysteine methyltransferase
MNKNNNFPHKKQRSEEEDFNDFIKSVEDMEPEEARIMFQNIVETMEEEGEFIPFPLRLLISQVQYGVVETPVGLVYGIGGLGQLMFAGFITQEDIEELGDTESVLETIMDDFHETIPTALTVRDDDTIGELIFSALDGSYQVNQDVFEAIESTDLQRAVWEELTKVPYGTTISYEELALRIGNPKAVRAVASAVGDNPISIAIPCHRIVLKSGDIGEYHWGSEIKEKLLAYEKARSKA